MEKPEGPPSLFPYIIVFAVLTVGVLAAVTWVIGEWYKAYQCFRDPNIWCFDTWQCANNCAIGAGPALDVANCFGNATQATGLASCIYGPNSFLATYCFSPQAGATAGGPLCECSITAGTGGTGGNCLVGCPQDLSQISATSNCCCCPGQGGCPWTVDTFPEVCGDPSQVCGQGSNNAN